MKELTIEEKAKAYDEVRDKIALRFGTNVAKEIFSQFEENEDERIRKALVRFHKSTIDIDGIKGEDVLAWLERQGEHLENFDEAEKEKSDFVGDGFIKCFANFLDFKEGNTYWLEYMGDDKYNVRSDNLLGKTYHITPCQLYTVFKKLTWLEKQGEQKPQGKTALEAAKEEKVDNANKVEPKFKVGDWIIDNNIKTPFQITGISNEKYDVISIYGNDMAFSFREVEHFYHLWTIQDAKDGDVFTWDDSKCIAIFKNIYDEDSFNSYGFVGHCTDKFESRQSYHDIKGAHPAIKEQRDTLERAMADAGYTFDFEKKELKKIVVPIFNIGDTIAKKHNSDIHDFGSFVVTDITDGKYWYNDRIICDITEQDGWEIYEPVRQKPAEWSKEDKEYLNFIISIMKTLQVKCTENDIKRHSNSQTAPYYGKVIDWLKSLKPQPKQEWSEEDEKMYASIIDDTVQENQLNGKQIDWLRNIKYRNFARPQNTWKPSDEQIKVCKEVYADILSAKGFDLGTVNSELNRLEEQLKK